MTYFLAVLAACANATSSVLQRKAARRVPQRENLSLRMLLSLVHEPAWFGGMLAVTVGFLLQAAALGSGHLSVVEPILVFELPATLLLASRVFHTRLHRREWGSAAAMTVSLAGLLYFLSPTGGHAASTPLYEWGIGIGINVIFIAAMVAWGRHGPAGRRPRRGSGGQRGQDGQDGQGGQDARGSALQAAVFGVAAGAGFGLTAALIKGMTANFSRGWVALFTSWQLYAMIVAGALSMFLLQSAMNAGRLVAAQPALTLTDPIVAILWGGIIFGERVRSGLFILLAVLSGLLMAAAVVMLARSPLLSGQSENSGTRKLRPARRQGGKGDRRPRYGS